MREHQSYVSSAMEYFLDDGFLKYLNDDEEQPPPHNLTVSSTVLNWNEIKDKLSLIRLNLININLNFDRFLSSLLSWLWFLSKNMMDFKQQLQDADYQPTEDGIFLDLDKLADRLESTEPQQNQQVTNDERLSKEIIEELLMHGQPLTDSRPTNQVRIHRKSSPSSIRMGIN